ncbi:hypothetical protein E2562_035095, partial [Oryza meyeriana var. granulata]
RRGEVTRPLGLYSLSGARHQTGGPSVVPRAAGALTSHRSVGGIGMRTMLGPVGERRSRWGKVAGGYRACASDIDGCWHASKLDTMRRG